MFDRNYQDSRDPLVSQGWKDTPTGGQAAPRLDADMVNPFLHGGQIPEMDDLQKKFVGRAGVPEGNTDESGRPIQKRPYSLAFGFVALVVAACSAGVWIAYQEGMKQGARLQPPVIRADPNPIKITPDAQGQSQTAHADKLVYETIDPSKASNHMPSTATILPGAETPLPKPGQDQYPAVVDVDPRQTDPQAALNAMADQMREQTLSPSANESVATTTAANASAVPPPPNLAKPAALPGFDAPKTMSFSETVAPKPATLTAPTLNAPTAPQINKPAIVPTSPEKASPAAPTVSAPSQVATLSPAKPQTVAPTTFSAQNQPGNGFRLQLGAFRSPDATNEAWNKLARENADILAGLKSGIARIDIEGQGTYYRLQAGGYQDRASANAVCDRLKARNVSCMIVKQ